jgi:signal transduction histidine kinase/DNA-binding response OmpR family regulator
MNENNTVWYTYTDEPGIIWFGTPKKGLCKLNVAQGSFHFYSNDPNNSASINNNGVVFILPDKNDVLWIGTFQTTMEESNKSGLNRFDKTTEIFRRFLNGQDIMCIYEDRRKQLWIGTDKLELFNRADESIRSFKIKNSTITTMYEDRKENFWLGVFGYGLYLFDRDKGVPVYSISEKDGLPNNDVNSILEDNSGKLWLGTSNGLAKFDPETRTLRNYFTSDVSDQNRYQRNSASKTSSGEMLFGTYDGLIAFNPDNIKDDPVPPQVVIRNVSMFNKPDEKLEYEGFISELKELDLSYNENDLRFDFVGLHYGDPSKNKYKYMLENFDEDWVDAGTQRNATYTNLDAGEYVFKVKACNCDGVWNEEGASLKIIIPPPFWATWWAYSIYVLFFIGLLYSVRRYELNRTLLKNQHKLDEVKLLEREETDKIKSRFFANISHEFRTPLTLILGPADYLISKFRDEEIQKQTSAIKRNANRLLVLINQLLDLSKLEAGKLELKASRANIVPFIKGITMSFESIAERKDITLKVKSEGDEIEVYFDKEKMTKIITNLLSNAFKFTPEGGAITVALSLIPSLQGRGMSNLPAGTTAKAGKQGEVKVQIKVSDTGIGISEEELPRLFDRFYQVDSSQTREHEGTGIGLALTKELVELHHGTISVDSTLGSGTEFTIELPIGRSHLKDVEIVEEETESAVILNEVKNLQENDNADYTPFDSLPAGQSGRSVTENADEDKYIVLVVEDNSDVREFIKDSLRNNFIIEEASNGEQGVRKAEQIIPDLIISDIMMPKMDGNELTRILKSNEKTSHIPIILLTAKSEQESKLEGLETGADDYLTKPFDTKELQIRIKNLISIRRRLQERYSMLAFVPAKKETKKKLTNLEEQFICKVMEVIEKHISEEEFSIEQFGKEVGMSRVQLHRKLKALSGKSASNYLRSVRLSRAKKMIEEEKGNISEIAYSVGFSSPQYFTRCFKEEFGYPPSDLIV